MSLNDRQRRFIDEYLIDMNATQAAIRAGYSERTARSQGQRLLTHVDIKRAIDERMKEHEEKLIADQEEILQYLTSVIRGEALGKEKLGVGKGAETIVDRKPTTQERIRAAEQLGKRYGMWTDRHEVEHKLPTFVEDVPDED